MPTGVVIAIYVSPEAEGPMTSVEEVSAVVGRGLEGDRYFDGRGSFSRWPGEGRDVTFIEREAIDAVLAEHGVDLRDGRSRRNIVTAGVRLDELNGRQFRIGEAVVWGARVCAPCKHLERLLVPGTFDAMTGRGGLRGNIRQGGLIRVADVIEFVLAPTR
jgi:MOSC domain-containing protein YiiM